MASSSDAVEDSLVTAQRALAVVYEDAYPCSNSVRQGLEGILSQRYGGSQHEFTNEFITPTILLLKRLKAKGFPLVKEGKVIVHLLAPSNHLESGEMFYQIGHTTPGTLALKFTKYQGNLVVLQPGAIEEQELHLAFTQQYIDKMRKKATRLGDQLMRVLLTSTDNGRGVYAIDKIEVKKIMPDSSGDCTGSACHPPVMETGMPKCFEASDSQHFPATGNCSDQAIGSRQTGPEPGRQPHEHSSGTSANNQPLFVQAVRGDSQRPTTAGHQTDDHVGDNPSPVTGHHSPNPNPAYPPLAQAVQDDPVTSATSDQSREHSSTGDRSNPAYPSLMKAVKDDPTISATVDQTEGRSRSGSGTNPAYPPLLQTVQDDATTSSPSNQSQEHSSTGHISNPSYPPIMQAVRDNPLVTPATDHQLVNNPAHSPRTQATDDDSTTTVRDEDPCMPVDDLDLF